MVKKIPYRKCVATNEQFPKKDLLRIVKSPDGVVFIDPTGKANGRGVYVKKDKEAIALAIKKKSIERALETTLSKELVAELLAYYES